MISENAIQNCVGEEYATLTDIEKPLTKMNIKRLRKTQKL